ncbi:MAG: sirohydrochlorin cobaltochelatase, partial [Desulfocapsaceae bacterium]
FTRVAHALQSLVENSNHGAALILGHGTDHPCRASYLTLQAKLHSKTGPHIFFTTIEKPVDPPEIIIQKIRDAGYKEIFCVPFLMVAGMHFFKDIDGDHPSSWRNLLKAHQIEIDLHDRGLAHLPGVDEIFCDHIQSAFDSMGI